MSAPCYRIESVGYDHIDLYLPDASCSGVKSRIEFVKACPSSCLSPGARPFIQQGQHGHALMMPARMQNRNIGLELLQVRRVSCLACDSPWFGIVITMPEDHNRFVCLDCLETTFCKERIDAVQTKYKHQKVKFMPKPIARQACGGEAEFQEVPEI